MAEENKPEPINAEAIAAACVNFTGAEIAQAINDAMWNVTPVGLPLTTQSIIDAAKLIVPQAISKAESIATARAWAKGRTVPASPDETSAASGDIVSRSLNK